MANVADAMKVLLADNFAFYLKAHNYHWNVEGPDFPQLHSFFGSLYEEVWGAVDSVAEHIRTLDAYSPGSLSRFKELTSIEDELKIPPAPEMCRRLYDDNQKVLASIKIAFEAAEADGLIGLSDFLQGRSDVHQKHAWMLRSLIKKGS